jgi:hypothetical protein
MITEDHLEQLAIQWHKTLIPTFSHGEKEEERRLVDAVRWMFRPFRAWDFLGDVTQGVALSCRMMPRWGVCNSQGFLVSCNQVERRLNP